MNRIKQHHLLFFGWGVWRPARKLQLPFVINRYYEVGNLYIFIGNTAAPGCDLEAIAAVGTPVSGTLLGTDFTVFIIADVTVAAPRAVDGNSIESGAMD